MIPQHLVGVWQRTREEDPIGTLKDDSSSVYWVQTHHLFADIRIPSSAHPSSPLLKKCFAGHGELLAPEKFKWFRHVDFQPPNGEDVGILEFLDETTLQEDGEDGSYREIWIRKNTGSQNIAALQLVTNGEEKENRIGIWVVVDGISLRVVGRNCVGGSIGDTIKTVSCRSLQQLAADMKWNDDAISSAVMEDFHAQYGEIVNDGKTVKIQHSISDDCAGADYNISLQRINHECLEEITSQGKRYVWKVLELTGSPFGMNI